MAELQANLDRERRNFAATQQRLRDKDYQEFQVEMREDQQAFRKQERIANQQFSAVEATKQRDFQKDMQKTGAYLQMLQTQYAMKLQDAYAGLQAARNKAEQQKYSQMLYDTYNEMNQTLYKGTERESKLTRHFKGFDFKNPKTYWRLMPAAIGYAAGSQMMTESGRVEPEQFQFSNKAFMDLVFDKARQHGVDPMQGLEIVKSTPELLNNPQWRGVLGMPTEFLPGQTGYGKGDPIGRSNMALQQLTSFPQPLSPGAQIPLEEHKFLRDRAGNLQRVYSGGGQRMLYGYPSMDAVADDFLKMTNKVQ